MKIPLALVAVAMLVATSVVRAQQPQAEQDRQPSAAQHGESGAHSNATAPHGMDDAMYVQMMTMHHEQGVKMAELALEKAQRAEVKQFAQKTKAAQQQDIEELGRIGSSLPAGTAGHAHSADHPSKDSKSHGTMHDSKHMQMGQEMIETLEHASGASFDDEFVRTMLHHHEMAIRMSQPPSRFTSEEVKAFASKTLKMQGEEVKELKALQGTH